MIRHVSVGLLIGLSCLIWTDLATIVVELRHPTRDDGRQIAVAFEELRSLLLQSGEIITLSLL